MPRKSQPLPSIELIPITGLAEVQPGDDLAALVCRACRAQRTRLENGDILVVAQKIASKSEGALVNLTSVVPSAKAIALATKRAAAKPSLTGTANEPRFLEVVLQQSRRIVRDEHVLIVETHHGFVCANAGVDHSNVPGDDFVTVLPRDPDRSAANLARALRKLIRRRIAVIISDTFGRPWRLGLTNVAIGASGLPVLLDLRGKRDRTHKPLHATILAVADELASAAGLVMGKAEGIPAVIVRGYRFRPSTQRAAAILRPPSEDLFR
jgi:coenzyme F420-0:L-glutamate ligase / coenzyme F420-1:gamma-L-glutamate ligase